MDSENPYAAPSRDSEARVREADQGLRRRRFRGWAALVGSFVAFLCAASIMSRAMVCDDAMKEFVWRKSVSVATPLVSFGLVLLGLGIVFLRPRR